MKPAHLERHRLDRAARDRTAGGDGLQLRHHHRHESVAHRLGHQVDEGDARLGDADPPHRIDREDGIEVRDVDLLVPVAQVARLGHLVRHRPLAQGDGPCARLLPQLAGDARHLSRMLAGGRRPRSWSSHAAKLVHSFVRE